MKAGETGPARRSYSHDSHRSANEYYLRLASAALLSGKTPRRITADTPPPRPPQATPPIHKLNTTASWAEVAAANSQQQSTETPAGASQRTSSTTARESISTMSSRSAAKYESLTSMLSQLSTEQKEIMQAQEDRLTRLEELVQSNTQQPASPSPGSDAVAGTNIDGFTSTPELLAQMEEMMDLKIAEANKKWTDNFQKVNDMNQTAMVKFNNERWEALDKKIESQLAVFEAQTKGLSVFMTKIDRLLESYPLARQRHPEAQPTPEKRQKLMPLTGSPGERVCME